MRELLIDMKDFSAPRELHAHMADQLGFPEYYGHNLSALYDCLTDLSRGVCLRFLCEEFQNEEMEDYGRRVIQVCQDAADENPSLTVERIL